MGVRFHLRHHAIAVLAAGAVTLSGCGTAAAPGSGTSAPGGARRPAKVALTLTMTNGTGHALVHRTLRCDPPSGTGPDPAAACKALLRLKMTGKGSQPFAPASKHLICPMIMMSDKRIVVTGTWYGLKVRRIVLDGGCDVALFESMSKIMR
ncbi:MAG TPA: SSI family serine proteinase inhibitor [Streptosporangiaceae bacterium]